MIVVYSESLGLCVDKLTLEAVKLPFVSVSANGRIKIQHPNLVKSILRWDQELGTQKPRNIGQ